MTVEEIFKELIEHNLKGVMIHDELANYYDFLGLPGYKRCHEYHAMMETHSYRELMHYYISRYNKFLPEPKVEPDGIIPASWNGYTRQQVDMKTKQNAVKTGLEKWVNWEKETKGFYEMKYKELMEINEVAAALKVKDLICDVDCELKKAEQYHLNKVATGYNMEGIIAEQHKKHKKYKEKMKCFHYSLW